MPLMVTHPGTIGRRHRLLVLSAVLALTPAWLGAQARPDSATKRDTSRATTPSPSDSAARVRAVADSILLEDDPEDEVLPAPPPGVRQSVTLQSMNRGYSIGTSAISENVGLASYRWSAPDWRLMVNASPLRYTGNGTTISGVPPVSARLDWSFAHGDTLRLYGRSGSTPATLDSLQAAALGVVSVSTIDLESLALGTPAVFGARGVLSFELGGDVTLGVRAGLEFQPKPTGTASVYWTGTTVLGGLSLSGLASDVRWTGSFDLSKSSADSLLTPGDSVGRNLFQGGGSLNVGLQFDGPLTADGDATGVLGLWYQRPLSVERPDQPNRLLPVGDTFGVFASLDVPIGDWILAPSASFSREAAADDARTRLIRYRYETSSWAANTGVALTIPLGSRVDLTPEAGATFGNADALYRVTGTGTSLRRSFTARIGGWWAGVELTISF